MTEDLMAMYKNMPVDPVQRIAMNILEDAEDGNAAHFVTPGDIKRLARAYLDLLRPVEGRN